MTSHRDWLFEIDIIQRDMGRFLEEIYRRKPPSYQFPPRWQPSVDVYETDNEFIALVELAGVSHEDIEVVVDNNSLTIRGERRSTPELRKGEKRYCYQLEIYWGPFERTISLPSTVDPERTTATFYSGILEIVLPKPSKEAIHQIKIRG
jgi:HSP20 family protein